MFMFRYFFNALPDAQIVDLLARIRATHGIPYRLDDLSSGGQYNPIRNRHVYETYFKPNARTLKRRTGESITVLRSRSGRYFVSTPGTLALLRDNAVEWFTIGKEETLEFLQQVLGDGHSVIEGLLVA
jgi:hypothetical protein